MKQRKRFFNWFFFMLMLHFVVWVCWSFVLMDPITPFIDTFTTRDGRGKYLFFIIILLFCSSPYLLPIEEIGKDNS